MLPSPTGASAGVVGTPPTHNTNPMSLTISFSSPGPITTQYFLTKQKRKTSVAQADLHLKAARRAAAEFSQRPSRFLWAGRGRGGECWLRAWILGSPNNHMSHSLVPVWRLAAACHKGNVKIPVYILQNRNWVLGRDVARQQLENWGNDGYRPRMNSSHTNVQNNFFFLQTYF